MFTNKRWPVPALIGDWETDGPNLLKALSDYFLSLEDKAALDIAEARITASRGIKFPATAPSITDVNTLDDYEEGTWTPVLTFVTPGNLAITYSVQQANYTKVGRLVALDFNIVTSAFTHTTAAGNLQITGLPFMAANVTAYQSYGSVWWEGITKANYTHVIPRVVLNSQIIDFVVSGSGQAGVNIAVADTPTGGTMRFRGSIVYRV